MSSILVPMEGEKLTRLDDLTWSMQRQGSADDTKKPEINEIRLQMPAFSRPGLSYELAQLAAKTLASPKVFSKIDKHKRLILEIDHSARLLQGRWQVLEQNVNGLTGKVLGWIPFIKTYPPHHYRVVKILRPDGEMPSTIFRRIKDIMVTTPLIKICGKIKKSSIHCHLAKKTSFSDSLKQAPFSDPFTQIATEALQTVETNYVSERSVQGSVRIVVGTHNQLKIGAISSSDNIDDNRRTVRKFRNFVLKEYGPEHFEYVQYAYGFNFEEMIQKGLPLLPDHVFKVNVGVNNIEMSHLEGLYQRLRLLSDALAGHSKNQPLSSLWEYYHSSKAPVNFCLREIRNLLKVGGKDITDIKSLKSFLDRIIGRAGVDHLPHLSPEQFDQLVSLIWPSSEDISRILTGREITHLAICGYKTMGNSDERDPSRDLAELMQVYPGLQKNEDWDNFLELIAHVVVKKELFREYRSEGSTPVWRAGVLLPAPSTIGGAPRWYYVARVSDDGVGNLSYILLPASKGYRLEGRSLPMIHLYRSTNLNYNAIDAMGSIENDFNFRGSPGTLGEAFSKNRKGGYFFNRTIPLWVALLLFGIAEPPEKAIESFHEALEDLEKTDHDHQSQDQATLAKIRELKTSNNIDEIKAFLFSEGEKQRELPKYKKGQDLIFAGHSLGGALAQYGIHYFGPAVRRIPCPGFNFICRSYDSPATNASIDKEFMSFGRKYREIISNLGQRWKIFHQFEYGDFVPEVGESHLGTNDFDPEIDRKWLEMQAQIFRPLESAHALSITTCQTHGRRIGQAQENFDYRLSGLKPAHLLQYDHAWLLPRKLKKKFGYRILISPRITEILRRSIGIIGVPLIHFGVGIAHAIYPEIVKRNNVGVFSCEYHAASLSP